MSLLSQEEVKRLAQHDQAGPCVSIFMPTHRLGPETRQDPIRLKNLVTTAEKRLISDGLRAPKTKTLLEPAHTLIDDNGFWQQQRAGLALFLGTDLFRSYRLPFQLEERLVVGHRFHLKPLLPLLGFEDQFYVLAVSQNEVRLFAGTRDSMEPVDLGDVATSLAEALRFDQPEKQQQLHTGTTSTTGAGQRAAMFHGHGVGTDEAKENLLRFFQQLEQGVTARLHNSQAPLILAGVDYLFPIYQAANSYPHLSPQGITGNPEALSATELHKRAWPLVEANFKQAQRKAANRYQLLTGTNQVSNALTKIVPAAHYGQIETLFIAQGERQWGHFDPASNTLHLHLEATATSDDVVDLAAVQTFLNGGVVYIVAPDEVPGGPPLAAIFRY
ncbi:MAG: hypothetical protein KDF65_01750 [Anaerolineae bacterium]|nr:hypothetical protein [Anaerolineae bacterium]